MRPHFYYCSIGLLAFLASFSPLLCQGQVSLDEFNGSMAKLGLPTLPQSSERPPKADIPEPPLFGPGGRIISEPEIVALGVAKRARLAPLNSSALSSSFPRVRLNLFDDATYTARIRTKESTDPARVYSGDIESVPGSRVILAERNGVVAGDVLIPGRGCFRISFGSDGLHSIVEVGATKEAFCSLSKKPEDTASRLGAEEAPIPPPAAPESAQPVVDIMVLYSPAARGAVGGTDAMRTSICLEVALANQAFENSLINARLRLIHMRELNYVESTGDYSGLTNEADSVFVDVPGLADAYGADQVFLIGSYGAGFGAIGQQLTQTTDSKYALLSVPRVFGGEFIFAHEVGHNLGCDHQRQDPSPTGRYFAYSYGLKLEFENDTYGTIMALGLNPDQRILHFSNPLVLFTNYVTVPATWLPTGIPEGEPDAADNAKTINFTAPIVAAYKALLPATLSGARVTGSGQQFEADITGPPNSPCEVQFTTDFHCWEPLTHLTLSAQGGGSFVDPAFPNSPRRFYRLMPYAP